MKDLWPEVICTEASDCHHTHCGDGGGGSHLLDPNLQARIREISFDSFQWERKHRHALYVTVDGKKDLNYKVT